MEKGFYEYMCAVPYFSTEQDRYWINQRDMASLLNVSVSTIDELINDIYEKKELDKNKVSSPMTIFSSGNGIQYTFDILLAVAFRINTKEALEFRKWVTQVFDEYLYKGYVLDDKRFKFLLGSQTFYRIQKTLDML
ncbi:MAG: virulence RhuM family protein [Erysipelotrichaceae bacterium]|nr:virulence RhuM family protein [Erysipelotrichaceae bacterium]